MRKFLLSTIFAIISISIFAQGPVILGKYLPVKGSKILQAWYGDTLTSIITLPIFGQNQTWNYSTLSPTDTTQTVVKDINLYPEYANTFPSATHVFFSQNINHDTNAQFVFVDTMGMHVIGDYNFIIDSCGYYNTDMLLIPAKMFYGRSNQQQVVITHYDNTMSQYLYPAKTVRYLNLQQNAVGYGNLNLPYYNFNNNDVLLVKESLNTIDSVWTDMSMNGTYADYYNMLIKNVDNYIFLRNNKYGSRRLLQISVDTIPYSTDQITTAWYSLPIETGNISGKVFNTVGNTASAGVAFLFRLGSNFNQDDILAISNIDANGNYSFDSIPFGYYLIGVRPNLNINPQAIFTFYGDTARWTGAQILAFSHDTTNIDILFKHRPINSGNGHVHGTFTEDWNFGTKSTLAAGEPVPGAEIIIEQEPNDDPVAYSTTDNNGEFTIPDLPAGDYTIFTNVPGIPMHNTYSFTITGNEYYQNLDFVMTQDSIYTTGSAAKINKNNIESSILNVFPNPTSNKIIINFNVDKKSIMSLNIFDTNGKLVKQIENSKTINKSSQYFVLNLNDFNLSAGTYYIKLNLNDKIITKKIIKK